MPPPPPREPPDGTFRGLPRKRAEAVRHAGSRGPGERVTEHTNAFRVLTRWDGDPSSAPASCPRPMDDGRVSCCSPPPPSPPPASCLSRGLQSPCRPRPESCRVLPALQPVSQGTFRAARPWEQRGSPAQGRRGSGGAGGTRTAASTSLVFSLGSVFSVCFFKLPALGGG